MKFQPKTEKEISEVNLWAKGNYAFEILEAEETTSNSGNEMIKLKVEVFKDDGKSQNLFDYLLGHVMEFKLRHLAEACDLLADYENGELEAYKLVGKNGYCKVGHTKPNDDYPIIRNQIADYLVDSPAQEKTLTEVTNDDSVPF